MDECGRRSCTVDPCPKTLLMADHTRLYLDDDRVLVRVTHYASTVGFRMARKYSGITPHLAGLSCASWFTFSHKKHISHVPRERHQVA